MTMMTIFNALTKVFILLRREIRSGVAVVGNWQSGTAVCHESTVVAAAERSALQWRLFGGEWLSLVVSNNTTKSLSTTATTLFDSAMDAAPLWLRLLVVFLSMCLLAWLVSRFLARRITRVQCVSLFACSLLFLDSDACALAVILAVLYNVVVPLAWWSFRQYAQSFRAYLQQQWVEVGRKVCKFVTVAFGLLWGLSILILKHTDTAPPIVHHVLSLLFIFWYGKRVAGPWMRGKMQAVWVELCWYVKIAMGGSCAVILGCTVPMAIHSYPLTAAHVVLDALFVRWLWQQMMGYLMYQLQACWNKVARVARGVAATVSACLAVILLVWFLTVPEHTGSMIALLKICAVGHSVWVCGPAVGRHLIRILQRVAQIIVAGHGIAVAVRDARQQEAMVAIRRSPRLAVKPRVNYTAMMKH